MPENHLDAEQLGLAEPISIQVLRDLMRGAPFAWWIAGGWALDLLAGRKTRPHSDIDIAVLRRDLARVREWLPGWQLWYVTTPGKGLDRLHEDEELPTSAHEIWTRKSSSEPWLLEVLVEESAGDDWCYRRNDSVRVRISQIGETNDGLRLLRPEIVLLYKSKAPRERDDQDLAIMLPALSDTAREWLAGVVSAAHPTSPWVAKLTGSQRSVVAGQSRSGAHAPAKHRRPGPETIGHR